MPNDHLFEKIIDLKSEFDKLHSEREIRQVVNKIRLILINYEIDFDIINTIIASINQLLVNNLNKDRHTLFQIVIGQIYFSILDKLSDDLDFNKDIKFIKGSLNNKIVIFGNNGVGKTSFAIKLALLFKRNNINVVVTSLDDNYKLCNQRLWELCQQNNIPILDLDYLPNNHQKIRHIINKTTTSYNHDLLIVDTQGYDYSNQNNTDKMNEIVKLLNPNQSIMVIDAFTSQNTLTKLSETTKSCKIDSLAVTKYDGLSFYGIIISLQHIFLKPLNYLTVGEETSQIQIFSKEYVINNILNNIKNNNYKQFLLKSIKTYVAQQNDKFSLKDLLIFLKEIRKKGLLDHQLSHDQSKTTIDLQIIVISSMTNKERENVNLLNKQRILRISRGCGMEYQSVYGVIDRIIQIVNVIHKILEQNKKLRVSDKMKKIITDIIC